MCERHGVAGIWCDAAGHTRGGGRGARRSWHSSGSARSAIGRRASWPTASSGCWRSRWRWRPTEGAAARRTGSRRAAPGKRRHCSKRSPTCRPTSRCCSSSTTWRWCSVSPARSSSWCGGTIFVEGTPAEIAADPRVREVYLGDSRHGLRRSLQARRRARRLWRSVVIDGVSLELAEGGSLARARPQRRRQDDAAAHHHGLHPLRGRPHALARSRHRPDARRIAGPRLGIGWVRAGT